MRFTNTGNRTALDIRNLEDSSDFVTSRRQVIPNFENFEALVQPPGWSCFTVGGNKLVRCEPNEFNNTLQPDESYDFLFAFDITEERPWPEGEEVCNTATVHWEGNRRASNGGESCLTVDSPGAAGLEVTKTLIDGITGEPATVPPTGYRPGDLLDFRVQVTNTGQTTAFDLGTLEDSSQTPIDSRGDVYPSFQSGGAIAYPSGWRCGYVRGADRLECRPPPNTSLAPMETLEFIFRMRLADPIQGRGVDRLCNRAAIEWRDGIAVDRACFPVTQNPDPR